jgi:hypothetical protein
LLGEIVSDTEEKESINHKPVFPDSNVEEDFSPKSKKSALDDLRNMKFAKKDPFNEAS